MASRMITRLGFAALACAPLSVALGEGSELPDGSVTIDALPFLDTGDITDNLDDYDAACPWESDSPDVFYAYTPPPDVAAISIWFCRQIIFETHYDAKLFLLDSAFNEIACNDDFCATSSASYDFTPFLECHPVTPGQTIHIAVDGWGGDAGPYEILIEACTPPPICVFGTPGAPTCPEGAIAEGEACAEDVEDTFNGGCTGAPAPLLSSVSCGDTVCGEVYQGAILRDTDWYALAHPGPADVTMTGVGENDLVFGRIDDSGCAPGAPECNCIGGTVDPFVTIPPCIEDSVTALHTSGESWWFVSTVSVGAVPCGSEEPGNDYVMAWTCATPPCCTLGDTNEDGAVDFADLVILLANWGPCGG